MMKFSKVCLFLIAAILVVSININVMAENNTTDTFSIKYNVATKTLSVDGYIAEQEKCFLNIEVFPYGSDISLLNSFNNVIFKTIQVSKSGIFSETIVLPDSFTNGRYTVVAHNNIFSEKGMFVYINPSQLSTFVSQVNSCTGIATLSALLETNATVLGLDDGSFSDIKSKISSIILGRRTSQGYSINEFVEQYMVAEAVSHMLNGTISFDAMIKKYVNVNYLNIDLTNDYTNLSAESRTSLSENMPLKDYTGKAFSEIFSECLFITRMQSSTSYLNMQSVLIAYYQQIGRSLSDYYAINNQYYQDNVFREMYALKSSMNTAEYIYTLFDNQVPKQNKDSEKAKTSSNSSGDGGSGTTYINAPIATLQPSQMPFGDIDSHWAKNEIVEMNKLGVVNGFEGGIFKPEQYVTRAEFTKMIISMLNVSLENKKVFDDVSTDSWYAPYIFTANSIVLIYGNNGKFNPNDRITREDVAVILYRALKYKGVAIEGKVVYDDQDKISSYAKDVVSGLSSQGIIKGWDNKFHPKDSAKRAEVVSVLYRVIKYFN